MKLYSLKIKDTVFKVAIISDKDEMKKGLSGKPKLGIGKGLLFDFKSPQKVTMNMSKMLYPLDMVFIDESLNVIDVRDMRAGDIDTTCDNCRFVLEINRGEGDGLTGEKVHITRAIAEECDIKIRKKDEEAPNENIIVRSSSTKSILRSGGSFKLYEEDVKAVKGSMQVLDDTGRVLMNIKGGERIFSIKHTDALVALSKKVDLGEADEKELGKLMSEIIEIQNTQKPEYV